MNVWDSAEVKAAPLSETVTSGTLSAANERRKVLITSAEEMDLIMATSLVPLGIRSYHKQGPGKGPAGSRMATFSLCTPREGAGAQGGACRDSVHNGHLFDHARPPYLASCDCESETVAQPPMARG